MTPTALAPAGFAMLIVFMLYRRFRRLFGRQIVQPARMRARIAMLVVVAVLLMLRGARDPAMALALTLGFGAGALLAVVGLRLTTFETTPEGRSYTPHGGIGVVLSALLLGRLAYRAFVLAPVLDGAHAAGADPFAAFHRSPLTFALFGLLVAYYVAYYIGILLGEARPPKGSTTAVAPPRAPDA
ncbi:DUF1453 domain-containing protein [Dokdonella fugitiva]|uniref:DUF1453 domain-containing protein n=1 Tax=Dokdonella fugitiva TaxID=328517 RepID=A0A4V2S340_9GAMM|nr:DUF1453 domain-containing protein [Dokdonella fugitiva]MBA8882324.1 drug/metabolite transporter superfamily protein YnfA [Dokdonella fugitiva]TCO42870.1 hypothetical protein EV148_101277 [Dokdonella fugitiva]